MFGPITMPVYLLLSYLVNILLKLFLFGHFRQMRVCFGCPSKSYVVVAFTRTSVIHVLDKNSRRLLNPTTVTRHVNLTRPC